VGMVNETLPPVGTLTVRSPRCWAATTEPGPATPTLTSSGASGAGFTVTV